MSTKISYFLDKLQGAKRTKPGRWIAKCPAHADKSPSLSITETSNGDVLLYCFAGCQFGDILAALNLQASDCYANPRVGTRQYKSQHRANEIDAELEILQSRYGFSESTAKALVRIGLLRQGRISYE